MQQFIRHGARQSRLLLLCVLFVLCSVQYSNAATINGTEWMQVNDYTSMSWSELDSIFDQNGFLEASYVYTAGDAHDFRGLRWASEEEVMTMFYALDTTDTLENYNGLYAVNSGWAPLFVNSPDGVLGQTVEGAFDYTWREGTKIWVGTDQYYKNRVMGLVRDPSVYANNGRAFTVIDNEFIAGEDVYYSDNVFFTSSYSSMGAFLYKVNPVPIPSTLLLLAFGLLSLAGIGRKKTS